MPSLRSFPSMPQSPEEEGHNPSYSTAEVRGSNPLGSTPIILQAFDISPLASTEPPLVPGRASPPQLRLQTLDQQALFLKLLQKSVPLPPKDNDAPDLLGMLRYLP